MIVSSDLEYHPIRELEGLLWFNFEIAFYFNISNS